ncbi:hypothetical protein SLE2022_309120 [Rubroshorea leprosula]
MIQIGCFIGCSAWKFDYWKSLSMAKMFSSTSCPCCRCSNNRGMQKQKQCYITNFVRGRASLNDQITQSDTKIKEKQPPPHIWRKRALRNEDHASGYYN